MKKYTKPELLVSKFDVEDVITTSGVFGTGYEAVKGAYGELYTDAGYGTAVDSASAASKSVVYFNWE